MATCISYGTWPRLVLLPLVGLDDRWLCTEACGVSDGEKLIVPQSDWRNDTWMTHVVGVGEFPHSHDRVLHVFLRWYLGGICRKKKKKKRKLYMSSCLVRNTHLCCSETESLQIVRKTSCYYVAILLSVFNKCSVGGEVGPRAAQTLPKDWDQDAAAQQGVCVWAEGGGHSLWLDTNQSGSHSVEPFWTQKGTQRWWCG